MINFNTKLYTSPRTYINEIEKGRYVFFSPDTKGLPIIVKEKAKEILERFNSGTTVLQALEIDNIE